MTIDSTISLIIRLLLVFVFLRAAMHKMRNFHHFSTQLIRYRLVARSLIPTFSMVLILIEVSLVFTLLVASWRYPSLIAAAVLAVYTVAMSINLVRGRNDLDCGCTGPAHFPQTIGWALVIRNTVLVIFALATALPMTSRALSIQDISTIVLASIAVMFLYASIEQSITNQQRQKHYFALKRKDHSDALS
jgi:hypothetical protein